jgi:hypothetical protein
MSGALRPIIVHVGTLCRSLGRHPCKDYLVLLRDHADEIEIELVAHIFLFNNSLLCLWLDIFANHKGWLILLSALLAVAGGLGSAIVGSISFKTSDGFAMRLLRLCPRVRMLARVLY